jgi:hypothetical protein
MVIGGSIIVVIIAMIYCFFGFRLARIILPLCGVTIIAGLMYIFLIDFYTSGGLDQWIFIVCCVVALYVILFLLKRFASFIVGVCGAGLMLLFFATALELASLPFFYPAAITVSLLIGCIGFVYQRTGVIIATSLFGGGVATFVTMFIIFGEPLDISGFGDLISEMSLYFSGNAPLVTTIAICVAIVGVVAQVFATGKSTVLAGRHGLHRKTQKFVSDEINTPNNSTFI